MAMVAKLVVAACWLLFAGVFAVNHLRVRRKRTGERGQDEHRAPVSMAGLALEGLALLLIVVWRRMDGPGPIPSVIAVVVAVASVGFAAASLRHLDMQWRIKAVVTADHQLIRSGPYAIVRHPIYLALFGMAIATALVRTSSVGALFALAIYLIGTEIRVRAEDQILAKRFGVQFEEYRQRVPAYLPGIR